MYSGKTKIILISGAVSIIVLWIIIPLAAIHYFGKVETAGVFGDAFGFVNALFSGLALIGVVAAIYLQQQELALSTKELRASATALRKQVELAADTSRLEALPTLIELHTARIKNMGGQHYGDIARKGLSSLEELQADIRSTFDAAPKHLAELQEELKRAEAGDENAGAPPVLENEISRFNEKLALYKDLLPEIDALVSYARDLPLLYKKVSETKLP